jgi:hypothetical protein
LAATLKLGSLFGLWYLFNIYFNIYNKQAWQNHHKIFPAQVIICIFCLLDLGRWCACYALVAARALNYTLMMASVVSMQ